MGKGEISIFPITVMKLKAGINYNPEDKNYDLFKLAMRVSAKRLFPNFLSLDSSFNLPYYKEGDYRTEVASMGCADGDEFVVYQYDNKTYYESFKRMWDRLSNVFEVQQDGISSFLKPINVKIWDGNEEFVEVKTVVNNPDQSNWVRVKFNNGRHILVTKDHPLYTENKGRVSVSELSIGDTVKSYWNLPIVNEVSNISEEQAYMLGLLLVDGCYDKQLSITLDTETEQDIAEKYMQCVKNVWNKECTIKHFNRGEKGVYDYINIPSGYTDGLSAHLNTLFGGLQKIYRHIPNEIFNAPKNIRLSFLAGMIDGDGYVSYKSKVQIGSINKELSLQQLALAQSVGLAGKTYINHYNSLDVTKIRYRVEFSMNEELAQYLASGKKVGNQWNGAVSNTKTPEVITVQSIEELGFLDKHSYDVETETDHFALSFINSGNCRTRTMGNINGPEIATSRGNFSFTTIDLPLIAIESNRDIKKFYKKLDKIMEMCKRQLLWRYEQISHRHAYNYPFLVRQGVWLGGEKLKPEDEVGELLKQASISIGYCGLAEALVALIGKHHGESEEAQKLGLEIISHMRKMTDKFLEETHLNFSLFASPKH